MRRAQGHGEDSEGKNERVVGVLFDPPVTIEECRLTGRQFGGTQAGMQRILFEQALVARLASLSDLLRLEEDDLEEAIAAFDQAAWTAWEAEPKGRGQDALEPSLSIDRAGDK